MTQYEHIVLKGSRGKNNKGMKASVTKGLQRQASLEVDELRPVLMSVKCQSKDTKPQRIHSNSWLHFF